MKHLTSLPIKILVALLLASTLLSCNTDDNNVDSDFYMRFLADGTEVEFKSLLVASFLTSEDEDQYIVTVSGADDATSNLALQIIDVVEVEEKTYTGFTTVAGLVIGVNVTYLDQATGFEFTSGMDPSADAEVMITELTETHIRGTFRATVSRSGQGDISISDGEFYVPRG